MVGAWVGAEPRAKLVVSRKEEKFVVPIEEEWNLDRASHGKTQVLSDAPGALVLGP